MSKFNVGGINEKLLVFEIMLYARQNAPLPSFYSQHMPIFQQFILKGSTEYP